MGNPLAFEGLDGAYLDLYVVWKPGDWFVEIWDLADSAEPRSSAELSCLRFGSLSSRIMHHVSSLSQRSQMIWTPDLAGR